MARVRDQNLVACGIPSGPVIGTDHGHAGEFTLGTGGRCQGDRVHTGDLLEDLLQLVQTGHDALAVTGAGASG